MRASADNQSAVDERTYTATFRPGTPETIVVGVLTVAGALFAIYIANVLRFVDCANEAWSECSTPGLVQLLIAWAGLLPALGTLVSTIRKRGHPWRWFAATGLVYAGWLVYVFGV